MEAVLNNLCKDCYFYSSGACSGEETESATDFLVCPQFEEKGED